MRRSRDYYNEEVAGLLRRGNRGTTTTKRSRDYYDEEIAGLLR